MKKLQNEKNSDEKLCIAVHKDELYLSNGHRQSYSDRWMALGQEAGYEMRELDAFSHDFMAHLGGCDGFMWRFGYLPPHRVFAKRLLAALEQGMQLPVFPNSNTAWHFEDKIAQFLLLNSLGVLQPVTGVFWNKKEALDYCENASYPFVIKLAHGFQSSNVRLVNSVSEAKAWVTELFGPGLASLSSSPATLRGRYLRRARAASRLLVGLRARGGSDFSHGYFYVQEFLPDNEFDTRITVIGDRAFGFRRFNRKNDFRASGSGHIDWDPEAIEYETVRIGFEIARRMRAQVVAIDCLRKGDRWVVAEISYTGASWAVAECPGYWRRVDETDDSRFVWVDGSVRPEDAIFEDFVERLRSSRADPSECGGR